jgi:methyl-accepting chemotaxis protein
VAASAIDIAHNSNDINATVETVSGLTKQGAARRKELQKVTGILYEITEHLQILSLNAMIEAARAGQNGKTFTVVANEVKKLADNGKKQLADIEKVIEDVNQLLGVIDKEVSSIQTITHEQSISSDEISASLQSVSSNIETLQVLAEKLK